MKNGILIYFEKDYKKNTWFVEQLKSNNMNISFKVLFVENMELILENSTFSIIYNGEKLENIDFALNRSRTFYISHHLEKMGVRVMNSSKITKLVNDKAHTHQEINSLGINSVKTYINQSKINFPSVVKSVSGHGGSHVFLCENQNDFLSAKKQINDEYIVQEIAKIGRDVRVTIVGNEILCSILRYSDTDFRANFSTGGLSKVYVLNDAQKLIIKKILEHIYIDFGAIDFIFDENDNFLFNEIEDACGTRTLYHNDIDIFKPLLSYIKKATNE